jgi:hypothetical protein
MYRFDCKNNKMLILLIYSLLLIRWEYDYIITRWTYFTTCHP